MKSQESISNNILTTNQQHILYKTYYTSNYFINNKELSKDLTNKAYIKAIVATLTISMLLFPMGIHANSIDASNNTQTKSSIEVQNQNLMDEKLSEMGFTKNQIRKMKDSQKEMLLEKGEVVEIVTKNYMLDKNGHLKKMPKRMKRSIMSRKVFSLERIIEKLKTKNGKKRFKFKTIGTWHKNPKVELKDIIAISWSDNFTLKNDYCYIEYRGGDSQDEDDVMIDNIDAEKGISHQINLRIGKDEKRIVQIVEVYTDDNNSGSANVVSDYAHAIIGLGDITAKFSGNKDSASIAFSASPTILFNRASDSYVYFDY
ncbi:hypothetical protein [Tepidibacter thalassicus]|uniref:Uncharacterized protein n=1 Tax=Tepidibacter thalassicus DSM 15285 TaxID=1123350 RepID=A0A1M5TUJ8_9FIRM|nr:hypothetical protein [Tepidibacter thalassicus]SHH54467.1 hypothetical protein SAMN02744040_02305 [Tepidibacter thalassicus DSM 15285]